MGSQGQKERPAQYWGRSRRPLDPPHGASTSLLRAEAFISPLSREPGLTECAGEPGGLQDGPGRPGALMEEGVELQHVSWGLGWRGHQQGESWGTGGSPRAFPLTLWCMANENGRARLGLLVTRGPDWCEHRGCGGVTEGPGGPSRGSYPTPSGWRTRRPGSGAGRWWPGTGARPAREGGPHGHVLGQQHGECCLPHTPQEVPGPQIGAYSPSLLAPLWVLAAPEVKEKGKHGPTGK